MTILKEVFCVNNYKSEKIKVMEGKQDGVDIENIPAENLRDRLSQGSVQSGL